MEDKLRIENLKLPYFNKVYFSEIDGNRNIGKKYFPIDDKVFHMGYLYIQEFLSYDLKRVLHYMGTFYLIGDNLYRETTSFSVNSWEECQRKIENIETSLKTLFEGNI